MSTNDITGDRLKSKASNRAYREQWELIWGNKKGNSREQQNASYIVPKTKHTVPK